MKKTLIIAIFFFTISNIEAQQITWDKIVEDYEFMGDYGNTDAFDHVNSLDSGIVITGTIRSDHYSLFITKINKYGESIWFKTYGRSTESSHYAYTSGNAIISLVDGGFVVAGANNDNKTWLLKFDSNGDTIWSRTYNGEKSFGLDKTSDDGFVLSAMKDDLALIIKTNNFGDTIWTKSYGLNQFDLIRDIKQTPDNEFIGVGNLGEAIWALKLSEQGDSIWSHVISGYNGYAKTVTISHDSCYIIGGSLSDLGKIVKLDKEGSLKWLENANCNYIMDIDTLEHNSYIIAGYYYDQDVNYHYHIEKFNEQGISQWNNQFLTDNHDRTQSITATFDGGFILAGYSQTFSSGYSSTRVLRLNENGRLNDTYEDEELCYGQNYRGFNETGVHFIIETSSQGVDSITQIYLVVHPLPDINLGNDTTICRNSYVLLEGGTGYSEYLWNTGSIEESIVVNEAGEYILDVIDTNVCANSDTILVSINELSDIDLGNDTTILNNESIILGENIQAESYFWSNGLNSPTITIDGIEIGIGIHEYWLEITDENSCSNSDTILITVSNYLSVNDIDDLTSLSIFPNPTRDYLNFYIDKPESKMTIKIYDSNGKLKLEKKYEVNKSFYRVNLNNWGQGLYFIHFETSYWNKVSKFIINK